MAEERYPMPEWFREWVNRLDPGPTEDCLTGLRTHPIRQRSSGAVCLTLLTVT